MAFYLSVHLIGDVVKELLKGGVYTEKTPAAVVYQGHLGRRESNQGHARRHCEKDKGSENNQDCADNRRRRDCACEIRIFKGLRRRIYAWI